MNQIHQRLHTIISDFHLPKALELGIIPLATAMHQTRFNVIRNKEFSPVTQAGIELSCTNPFRGASAGADGLLMR